jgi:hypothetical protein
MLKFRTLQAEEIECRVGTINEKGFTLLLYKDARVDMNILDEIGNMNWQREHKEVKGNLFCGVSIWDSEKNQWVTKWDCGIESNTEKEKGESSDSFKRACVNWGIGRELYTAPFIYIRGNVEKNDKGKYVPTIKSFIVVSIEYNDKREIIDLTISGDGDIIYSMNTYLKPKTETQTKSQVVYDLMQKANISIEDLDKWLEIKNGKVVPINDLQESIYNELVKSLKSKIQE